MEITGRDVHTPVMDAVIDHAGRAGQTQTGQYIQLAPHTLIFPGLAIMLTVLGFNLLGDGLRDALDPRMTL